jgi:glycosyltransferase involved in cell wall biosynthesis
MKVLYDGNIYVIQTAGGINRYFANLIGRLPADIKPYMAARMTPAVNFPHRPNLKVDKYRRFRPAALSYRLEKLFFKTVPRMRRYDLAHPTYYTLLGEQELADYRCPVVITVWDMIHELFAEEMDDAREHVEMKRKAILAADRIICISENTKRDLLRYYPVAEKRVSVTYLASEIDDSVSHGPEPVPERPYYLYVGSRSRYKNFDGLLRAFAKAVATKPDLALCVVGGPFTEAESRLMTDLKVIGHVEHFGHTTDSHLAKLYRCSVALVYPSLYEGFGIPPLEAMSCGTVAVVSNVSSLPEVVGDAGVMFDPRSTDDLFDILLSLLENRSMREALILKGKQRATLFSWERTAAQTVDIYRSLCQ